MDKMPVVTVTGAGGFIGSTLVQMLSAADYRVRGLVRRLPQTSVAGVEYLECGDIANFHEWDAALADTDVIVHLAARVHVIKESVSGTPEYRRVNLGGSVELARACAAHAVKRLVYISTIKVNGEATGVRAFTAEDRPSSTRDPYARSKRDTEAALFEIGRETGLEVTAIRPPLVYGPGVKGNFLALMNAVAKQQPLPFASIANARSLVSVFNLCDLIRVCLEHPAAAGETFLVCDGEDLATPELVRMLAAAMRRKTRLLPCPVWLLSLAGTLLGRGDKIMRLCGDLRVDMGKTQRQLGWKPPLTLTEGIERTVKAFLV